MDDAALAIALARGRMAVGAAAIAAPGLATRVMGDRQGVAGIAPVFARMLGARDIALGLGTVIALDRGKPVRGWLEAAALADAADSIASMLGREKLSPIAFKASAVLAAASAGVGMFLARRLDPAPPAHPGQPEAAATGHSTQAP
jgi:hypothetical protein